MKWQLFLFLGILCSLCLTAVAQKSSAPKVTIYYFHITDRCFSCVEIEKETMKLLKSDFETELKNGTLVFRPINVDLKENNELKTKYHMYGSGLLLVKPLKSGEINIELTNMAFQHIPGNAFKFRAELKTEINKLLEE